MNSVDLSRRCHFGVPETPTVSCMEIDLFWGDTDARVQSFSSSAAPSSSTALRVQLKAHYNG